MERFRIEAVTFFASTEAMGLALGTEVRSSGKVLHSVIKRVQEHQEAPGITEMGGGAGDLAQHREGRAARSIAYMDVHGVGPGVTGGRGHSAVRR